MLVVILVGHSDHPQDWGRHLVQLSGAVDQIDVVGLVDEN